MTLDSIMARNQDNHLKIKTMSTGDRKEELAGVQITCC